MQHLQAGVRPFESITLALNDWLQHILEPYELRTQNEHQHLVLQLAPSLPPVTTDFACLSRIVTELLNNACKFTPPQETITVTTTATTSHCVIQISNSGVEIPPEEQTRIFDKFYRIPNPDPWQYSGVGLGLALVAKLVAHIGGSIQVTSSDRLTRFTLQLPIHPNSQGDLPDAGEFAP